MSVVTAGNDPGFFGTALRLFRLLLLFLDSKTLHSYCVV